MQKHPFWQHQFCLELLLLENVEAAYLANDQLLLEE